MTRTYTITLTNGAVVTIDHVTRARIHDGVLELYRRDGKGLPETHLGAFPLGGVRLWVKTEEEAARHD